LIEEEPDSAPAVSPRLRRRLSAQPSEPSASPPRSSPTASATARDAPLPAHIHQVRAGKALRGFTTSVPHVLLSIPLAGPAPSGSTGTSRLCQGCSRPPRHHPDQAALSSIDLLRQAEGEGLPPPLKSQRLTAHVVNWTDPPAEALAGAGVERRCDSSDVVGAPAGQVGTLREVLAQ
jgi:hypothetical protein